MLLLSLQASAGWYPEHGNARYMHNANKLMASVFVDLWRHSAISSIPKLGGYSLMQLSRLLQLGQDIQGCQEAASCFTADVERHEAWCFNLRPVLER